MPTPAVRAKKDVVFHVLAKDFLAARIVRVGPELCYSVERVHSAGHETRFMPFTDVSTVCDQDIRPNDHHGQVRNVDFLDHHSP